MNRYAELICNGLEVRIKSLTITKLKSKLVEIIITNLAHNNSPSELELYFLQVSKDDQFRYELLRHTKGCVTASSGTDCLDTLRMSLKMLEYIYKELKRREKIVKDALKRRAEDLNIHEYNKKNPRNKLPVLMLWVDEASSLYEINKSMEDEEKFIRVRADMIVQEISKTGRAVGIYLINVLQRASKDEMSRTIKINSMNKVSFNQTDEGASMVAIGHNDAAIGLPQQVFVYKHGTDKLYYAKTPFSNWNDNVNSLSKLGYIRKDDDAIIRREYSHWLNKKEYNNEKKEEAKTNKTVKTKIADISNIIDEDEKVLEQTEKALKEKKLTSNEQKEKFKEEKAYVNNTFDNVKIKINK